MVARAKTPSALGLAKASLRATKGPATLQAPTNDLQGAEVGPQWAQDGLSTTVSPLGPLSWAPPGLLT